MLSSSEGRQSTDGAQHESNAVAVLTCPRCGRVDRMSYRAWAAWNGGIRCGLCGPPYVFMDARILDSESTTTKP